MTMFINIVDY